MPQQSSSGTHLKVDPTDRNDPIDRYERMLDIQIETLTEIDNKAVSVTKFTGTLLGVIVAAIGVVVQSSNHSLGNAPIIAITTFGVTVISLLTAIGYGIITFSSSSFKYGLAGSPDMVGWLVRLSGDDYTEFVLQGYANTIAENEQVVKENGRRLRTAQVALLTGLISATISVILFMVRSDHPFLYALVFFLAIGVWTLNDFILSGSFLVRQEQMESSYNE